MEKLLAANITKKKISKMIGDACTNSIEIYAQIQHFTAKHVQLKTFHCCLLGQ